MVVIICRQCVVAAVWPDAYRRVFSAYLTYLEFFVAFALCPHRIASVIMLSMEIYQFGLKLGEETALQRRLLAVR